MKISIFCIVLCLASVSAMHARAQDEVENLADNWVRTVLELAILSNWIPSPLKYLPTALNCSIPASVRLDKLFCPHAIFSSGAKWV